MSKSTSTSALETTIDNVLQNPLTLIVAALVFAAGFGLSGISVYSVSSASAFINIQNLITQFIAGLMVLVGIFLAFIKSHLGIAMKSVIAQKGTIASGAILWTIGMFFVGVANSQGFTPIGVVAGLVGYAIILVSLVLSGTIAALSASK
jgi:hypothetical protein